MRGRFLPYSLIVLAFLVVSMVLITQPAIRKVEAEVERTSRVIARLISTLLIPSITEEKVANNLREILKQVEFPIVVTDEFDIPRAWQKVGVDPGMFSPEELNRPEHLRNNPEYRRLTSYLRRLKKMNPSLDIVNRGKVVGHLYYGEPKVLDFLRVLPLLLMIVGILSFIALYLAARSIQSYQIETIWTGFARELAHQMGTPVSSLWGWFEFLKRDAETDPEIIRGMERDLVRLRSTLTRFSKIGGGEKLVPLRLKEVIEEVTRESRLRFIKDMDVKLDIREDVLVEADKELLTWSLENLIKNAYEARNPENPQLTIRLRRTKNEAIVWVIDNGKGISKDRRKMLFKKSFTTKERGWGLGLLLARRAIE